MDHPREDAERSHDSFYLVSGHLPPAGRGADLGLRGYLLGLGLGDPWADHCRISLGVDAGPVAGDLGVEIGDARQRG
ncbi:MAG TPA: hypothetical protein VHZ03_38675 [Trebonia sp.]|nr:hypothetical protein [Trebonia sp.]